VPSLLKYAQGVCNHPKLTVATPFFMHYSISSSYFSPLQINKLSHNLPFFFFCISG
jgi:hypothetical protein